MRPAAPAQQPRLTQNGGKGPSSPTHIVTPFKLPQNICTHTAAIHGQDWWTQDCVQSRLGRPKRPSLNVNSTVVSIYK